MRYNGTTTIKFPKQPPSYLSKLPTKRPRTKESRREKSPPKATMLMLGDLSARIITKIDSKSNKLNLKNYHRMQNTYERESDIETDGRR